MIIFKEPNRAFFEFRFWKRQLVALRSEPDLGHPLNGIYHFVDFRFPSSVHHTESSVAQIQLPSPYHLHKAIHDLIIIKYLYTLYKYSMNRTYFLTTMRTAKRKYARENVDCEYCRLVFR